MLLPVDTQQAQALQRRYACYRQQGYGKGRRTWPREAALDLGRLFVAAYGVVPPGKFLRGDFGMPDSKTIQRLFGTLDAYRLLLKEEETP